MKLEFGAIVAADEGNVIGFKGAIPWHFPEDMKRFAQLTKGHTVVMGKNTYFSLPEKFRPLPERLNIVVSSTLKEPPHPAVVVMPSFTELVARLRGGLVKLSSPKVWFIGGGQIYRDALPLVERLELTRVWGRYEGDAFFPELPGTLKLVAESAGTGYTFLSYVRAI